MEISRKEYEFVWNFYESLRTIGVENFPVNGELFKKGINMMGEYLKSNISNQEFEEVSLLFLPQPPIGDYSRFENEIIQQWLQHPVYLISDEPNKMFMKVLSFRGEKPDKKYIDATKIFCDNSETKYKLEKVV